MVLLVVFTHKCNIRSNVYYDHPIRSPSTLLCTVFTPSSSEPFPTVFIDPLRPPAHSNPASPTAPNTIRFPAPAWCKAEARDTRQLNRPAALPTNRPPRHVATVHSRIVTSSCISVTSVAASLASLSPDATTSTARPTAHNPFTLHPVHTRLSTTSHQSGRPRHHHSLFNVVVEMPASANDDFDLPVSRSAWLQVSLDQIARASSILRDSNLRP